MSMRLQFEGGGENYCEYVDSPSRADLFEGAQDLDRSKDIDAIRFFKNSPNFKRIRFLDSGADSRVYIVELDRIRLVKIFRPKFNPAGKMASERFDHVHRYREFTRYAIESLPEINKFLDAFVELDGAKYKIKLKIVPIQEPVENNGQMAIFIDGENWIMGGHVVPQNYSISTQFHRIREVLVADIFLNGIRQEEMYNLPYFRLNEAEEGYVNLNAFLHEVAIIIESVTKARVNQREYITLIFHSPNIKSVKNSLVAV